MENGAGEAELSDRADGEFDLILESTVRLNDDGSPSRDSSLLYVLTITDAMAIDPVSSGLQPFHRF